MQLKIISFHSQRKKKLFGCAPTTYELFDLL